MKKDNLNLIEFDNYGINNYSNGMECIVFNHKNTTLQTIINLPNIFLNPILKPNSLEVFAFKGTQQQYNKLHGQLIESYCTKQAFDKIGRPDFKDVEAWDKINEYKEDLIKNFVSWVDLFSESLLNAHEAQMEIGE